jgi:hypothetical protein
MRQMEQFSLRWEDVDLERGVLTLPTTKAGGVQYVRLNEEAKGLLQGFIPGNKSVWVFPSLNPDTHADPCFFPMGGIRTLVLRTSSKGIRVREAGQQTMTKEPTAEQSETRESVGEEESVEGQPKEVKTVLLLSSHTAPQTATPRVP